MLPSGALLTGLEANLPGFYIYTGNSKRTFFRKKKREKQIDDAANAKGQKK